MDLAEGYQEICLGQSEGSFLGKPVVFRHLTIFDQFKIDKERKKEKEWAASHGLINREQSIKNAIIANRWSDQKEKELNQNKEYLKQFWATRGKGKFISYKAIIDYHNSVKEMSDDIEAMVAQKTMGLETDQESHANAKAFDYEIFIAAGFDPQEFDNIREFEMSLLRNEYYRVILKFDDEFFKRLAVSSFFYFLFDNCALNPSDFFRKAICDLTLFQTKLLESAKRFHSIVSEVWDAPEEFFEKPEMMITAVMRKRNGGVEEKATGNFNAIAGDIEQSKKR